MLAVIRYTSKREFHTNRLVSAISDSGVAVNFGGAWGGFWYLASAMVTLTSGRELRGALCGGSEKWLRIVLTRAPKREEARMIAMEMKRMRLVQISRRGRDFASVPVGLRYVKEWNVCPLRKGKG
jgi:hypothetical protein